MPRNPLQLIIHQIYTGDNAFGGVEIQVYPFGRVNELVLVNAHGVPGQRVKTAYAHIEGTAE